MKRMRILSSSLTFILYVLASTLQIQFFMVKARKFTIVNNCSYPVWPAFYPSSTSTHFSLQSQDSLVVDLQPGQRGQVWGRTGCENLTGEFVCRTGDCGDVHCAVTATRGGYRFNAATSVDFSLLDSGTDFYDVSLVNGYNVPISVAPQGGSGWSCQIAGCIFDISGACPSELTLGDACRGACLTPVKCCTGNDSDCNSKKHSAIFKKACPRAYTYPMKDESSSFSCRGSPTFTVTFCPTSTFVVRKLSEPLPPSPPSSPFHFQPVLPPSPASTLFPSTVTPSQSPHNAAKLRKKKRKRLPTSVLVAISSSAAIPVMLLLGIGISMKKRKAMRKYHQEVGEIKSIESLHFDIHTIKTATQNFSVDNKLGKGGFGEVYKGMLENGQEVAVKRLLKNSRQGVAEFETEILLVARLQHKNLVKLLGFCVTSKEKILVYEFVRNSSLDRHLFDVTRNASLGWQKRFNIIVGIARGLLYLHEDSRLTVIHRDLKTSNVLLDEAMDPKISDFGLARLFREDQTQDDTKRIVGTYGYMAPEYALIGHYSVKSDVYSFGVIALEIISGQRNRFFGRLQFEEALLHRAWRLWNERKSLDMVDTTLNNDLPIEEVIRCIQIGLLCVQEDAAQRPTMRSVLDALSTPSTSLPEPKPPHIFGTSTNSEHHHSASYVYTGTETLITHMSPR